MVKKAVQQGHSKRSGEEVHTKLCLIRLLRSHASGEVLCLRLLYVEPLSDVRTKLADFFTILLDDPVLE